MGTLSDSPLGRVARTPDAYDPGLLYPVEREPQRTQLGVGSALPFTGADCWTAWETTWLDARGRPQVAVATFAIPCTSPRLVESKSVKLWLASLAHEPFASIDHVREALCRDLEGATGAGVDVILHLPDDWGRTLARRPPDGTPIDDEPCGAAPSSPDPVLLACTGEPVGETLLMRTFRSVCPVTAQPDYAEVLVRYRGPRIVRPALYAYLLGFRRHAGFHEHCVERIFVDIDRACRPDGLRVEARFTRRGGVDINPVRLRGIEDSTSAPTPRQ